MRMPKDVPEVGERCEWRGRGNRGRLEQVDTDRYWCTVKWDLGGPTIIHLAELRKLSGDT